MAALGGVYLLSSVFHIATRPVCCGVEAAVFVFGQQDFADVFAGLLIRNRVDVVEVGGPAVFADPGLDVAAAGVVGGEGEDVVAVEFALQGAQVPDAVADVALGLVDGLDGIRGVFELAGNPLGGVGHELHEADGAAVRVHAVLELALGLDDGDGQVRVDAIAVRVCLDGIAIREGIEAVALEGLGCEGQVDGKREEDDGARDGVEVLAVCRPARLHDALQKIRSFQMWVSSFLLFDPAA